MITNPIALYNNLDTKSDVGPLRPVQNEILERWNTDYSNSKSVILKMDTGQGKTLVGLLILQSLLNKTSKPTVYLCPNKQLVEQTCAQAERFGIKYVKYENQMIPEEFENGKRILITSCQSIFNGKSKFGIRLKSVFVQNIVLDDAHLCVDVIKDAFRIRIPSDNKLYIHFIELFSDDLKGQGIGTYIDIENGYYDSVLCVPYWAWTLRQNDVINILAQQSESAELKFKWPLLKNSIDKCDCYISGSSIEICPRQSLIDKFRVFTEAKNRILMSATTADDAFLIKDLKLEIDCVKKPLVSKQQVHIGEKMVLLPMHTEESISKNTIVNLLNSQFKSVGRFVITPSNKLAEYWISKGCIQLSSDNIDTGLKSLKRSPSDNMLVVANRYDGIDLPDDMCRILVIDGLPKPITLEDKYINECIGHQDIINRKIAQKIEQGFGRAVRGERDYCVIILLNNDLIQFIRSSKNKKFFSRYFQAQIAVGVELLDEINTEVSEGNQSSLIISNLIRNSLERDSDWKEYYQKRMQNSDFEDSSSNYIEILELERKAEALYCSGEYEKACNILQSIMDNYQFDAELKGWYLQLYAKYMYNRNPLKSQDMQKAAYSSNPYLLKPDNASSTMNIALIDVKRGDNSIKVIQDIGNYDQLKLNITKLLSDLSFGTDADTFEDAVDKLGKFLGFCCHRPDKEWKKGPDNVWKLSSDNYIVIECKNQVNRKHMFISKSEAGQFVQNCSHFEEVYHNTEYDKLIIIDTDLVNSDAILNDVRVMRKKELSELKNAIKVFMISLREYNFDELTTEKINFLLAGANLKVNDIIDKYSVKVRKKMM